ncbi:MAG TPA: tetratricopeptide repeat protein [Deltaproteobacteria bacterium]|nr:tetratricopeptide repeat protein [Deltaproteobacteria bacterium]
MKNIRPILPVLTSMLRHAMLVIFAILTAAGTAGAGDILIGASSTSTRIVFYLKASHTISPDVSEQNQTLIVNFPHTVAEPQTFQDRFLIQSLTFDGTRAVIAVKKPFTYTAAFKQMPTRFIIDVSEKGPAEEDIPCPIRRFDTVKGKAGISVAMALGDTAMPEVRAAKSGTVFITFGGRIACRDMERLLQGTPQLTFVRLTRMELGTTLALSLAPGYSLRGIRSDAGKRRVIFDMDVLETQEPSGNRRRAAEQLLAAGNSAGVVSLLQPRLQTLAPEEKVLLARAIWAMAFPYRMGETSNRALSLMRDAVQDMPEGRGRDEAMLEYGSMLIHAGNHAGASPLVKQLMESPDTLVRTQAALCEMVILNRAGSHQDAYAANKRLMMGLGEGDLPAALRPMHLVVLADTYLGLNDYPKALDLYRQALTQDPTYPRRDPGIHARMGEAAFKMGDFAQARDLLTRAFNLGDDARRQSHLLMLGDSLYQLGEKDGAAVVFSQVESLAPRGDSLVIAKLKTARIIVEKNTDERGMLPDRAFNEVMDIYESLTATEEFKDKSLASLVKVRIAQAYARHGDWEQAMDTYLEVWKGSKRGDTIHHYAQVEALRSIIERVRSLYRDSRHDQIFAIYTRYKDTFIKELQDSATLFIIGDTLNRRGDLKAARSMLDLSLRGDSNYKEQAYVLLFTIDMKQERYEEALIWNTLYQSSYPSGKDSQYMKERRGEALYRLGSLTACLPYLEASADAGGPLALQSLSFLSDAYRRLDMPGKQQQVLDRIISYHPGRVSPVIEEALYLRANQLRKTGDPERAGSLYQALLDAYPRSAHAHWAMYHLAGIAGTRGDREKAREILINISRVSKDPVLLSAARALSAEIELDKDLEGYEATKPRSERQ